MMKQKDKKTKFLACLLTGLLTLSQVSYGFAEELRDSDDVLTQNTTKTIAKTKRFSKNATNLNNAIAELDYNPLEVLASNGETIENVRPKEGNKVADKFIVVERTKKSISTTPVDISIIDSITDRTFPGAIQLADKSFTENKPNIVITKRKPITLTIDLPGKGDNSVTVKNPNYSTVTNAIDDLIEEWSAQNSETNTVPAKMQYTESMVHSESQIATALNVNSVFLNGALGVDFEAISSGEKQTMIVAYKQIFYTVSAELPGDPSDLFEDSVTFAELQRKGVSDKTPPLMVSNVSYGRQIFVKLETTSRSTNVKAAFNSLIKNVNVDSNNEFKDILDESTFTAVVLGGDSSEHSKLITTDFDEIREVIKANSEFSLKNPGYPISYTSVFVKDNSIAAVQNKTEYVETKSTEYTSGQMKLVNDGGFVAQFVVEWDELSYDEQGKEVLTHKAWDQNWQDKTAPFQTVIPLPANAVNIKVFAREATGLAWDWWRTVIDQKNVPLSKEIEVKLWGTTLNPGGSVTHHNP